MALVHPDQGSIADCCLKEVIPERLPGAIISPVRAVVSANLVGSIHTIHKMIVHVDKIRNLKALERLVSECFFDPFVLFVWSFSKPRNSALSINKCCHKQNDLGVFPCELKHLLIGRQATIELPPSNMV